MDYNILYLYYFLDSGYFQNVQLQKNGGYIFSWNMYHKFQTVKKITY